ncbi:MAG: hypothetical protein MK108_15485 [Mariniblastus sp.]|nr:hypothetical protein [Mariniblastus sp.]
MTEHRRPTAFNRRKIIWVSLVFLVAGYIYFQPQLEKWLGIELPTLDDRPVTQVEKDSPGPSTTTKPQGKSSAGTREYPSLSKQPGTPDQPWWTAENPVHPSGFQFQTTSKKGYLTSPAGLQYRLYDPRQTGGETSSGASRVDHILRHAQDDPSRPVHGVFQGNAKQILETIDEAYGLVHSDSLSSPTESSSGRVQLEEDDEKPFRSVYRVDMQRTIGFEGGRRGREQGHPELTKITLVINDPDSEIITAYPSR